MLSKIATTSVFFSSTGRSFGIESFTTPSIFLNCVLSIAGALSDGGGFESVVVLGAAGFDGVEVMTWLTGGGFGILMRVGKGLLKVGAEDDADVALRLTGGGFGRLLFIARDDGEIP